MEIHYIKLTPKAAKNYIGDHVIGPSGESYLKVYVTAIPEDSKANKAMIDFLSKEWKVPKSYFKIIAGQTSRYKAVVITQKE